MILANDITLPDDYTPAGNGTRDGSSYTGDSYTGVFDGDGHTISNVKNGLFGVLTGTVKNVSVEASVEGSSDSVGAVASVLVGGTISDVTVSGSVVGPEAVGGVVGRVLADGNIENCVNNASVSSTGSADAAGGIVGKAYYTVTGKEMNITNCANTGTISGKYAAGGIVGFSAANVIGCENSGSIVLMDASATSAGGIIGEQTNYGEIKNNINAADIKVSSGNSNAGGIIGWLRYQKSAAYAANEVVAISGNTNKGSIEGAYTAGGIVGLAYNQAVVTGNTNDAATISGGTFASGIVGGLQVFDTNLTVDADVRFVVTGNTTTTTEANIDAACVDAIAYNNNPGNDAFANISDNTIN